MEPSLSPNFIERGGTTIYTHTYHFYSRHYQLHPQVIYRIKYDLWRVNTLYFTLIYTTYNIPTRPKRQSFKFLVSLDLKKRSVISWGLQSQGMTGWFFGRLGNNFVGGKCLKPASQWEKKSSWLIIIYVIRDFDLSTLGCRTQEIPHPLP